MVWQNALLGPRYVDRLRCSYNGIGFTTMTQDERDDLLLNPRPGSAAARAKDFGVDLSLTLSNLRLTPEQLMEIDGYVEISAVKAVESIQQSQAQPFNRVLFGLNIPKVGWVMAQNLALHFRSVVRLMSATPEEIMEVEGIGPDRGELIAEWFADPENRRLAEELRALGLRFELDEAEGPKEGPLTGRSYVITGTLAGAATTRAAAESTAAAI